MKVIVVTGGIGSGKSVVSRVLMSMGMNVYDCDSNAKRLMASDINMLESIRDTVCAKAVRSDMTIDTGVLSATVFSDSDALLKLNSIVHGAVRADIARWLSGLDRDVAWIETAIARQSGILAMVDEEWAVEAPVQLRIQRVMSRNGLSERDIMSRIEAQDRTEVQCQDGVGVPPRRIIVNDGVSPVVPQIISLLLPLR